MKFCDKVKKERRAKGLTQQQFADMLGISETGADQRYFPGGFNL